MEIGIKAHNEYSWISSMQGDRSQWLLHRDKFTRTSEQASSVGKNKDRVSLSKEAAELQKLSSRDQQVRAHEAAHAAVGGRYAGSPNFTCQRGPNGKAYAVKGEVNISTSPIHGNPEATLEKAETIRRAAMAPANPSAQDRSVAAKAAQMAAEARIELVEENNPAEEIENPSGSSPKQSQEAHPPQLIDSSGEFKANILPGQIINLLV